MDEMSEQIPVLRVEDLEKSDRRWSGGGGRSRLYRRGQTVRKIDELTERAARALVSSGFMPLEIMRLLHLKRRTAYDLVKRAKETLAEQERARLEAKEREWRHEEARRQAEEAVCARTLSEAWQEPPAGLKRVAHSQSPGMVSDVKGGGQREGGVHTAMEDDGPSLASLRRSWERFGQ